MEVRSRGPRSRNAGYAKKVVGARAGFDVSLGTGRLMPVYPSSVCAGGKSVKYVSLAARHSWQRRRNAETRDRQIRVE